MEIFVMSAAGIYDWPIIKQVSWLLGQVMNGIYNALSAIGIENNRCGDYRILRLSYIRFFFRLRSNSRSLQRMSAVMQPEIQKIQKRYANKKGSGFHAETAGRDEYGLR